MPTDYGTTEGNAVMSTEQYIHELELKVKELEIQVKELNQKCEKEYFARLNAELGASTAKNSFTALVKELVDIRQQ